MKKGRLTLATIGAASALALVPIAGVASSGGGPVAQDLLGSGSDTTQFMMHTIDGLYLFSPGCDQLALSSNNGGVAPYDFSCQSPDPTGTVTTENYEHDQVHEAYFLGSGGGIHQLCNQGKTGVAHIDYARSSRVPATSDCAGTDFVAYARDGISWEAFDDGTAASGVNGMNNQGGTCAGSGPGTAAPYCLSQTDLQGIFITCTITNWSQVGGKNVPISIYTAQANSGTRLTWDADLGGDSSHCIPAAQQNSNPGGHIIPENGNAPIIANNDRAGAIFPFSYGIWKNQVHSQNNAILGAVDDLNPSLNNISSGAFPYGRYLFNVYCTAACATGASSAAAVNYVGQDGWICKPTGSHANNPVTGNNYRTDIANAITNSGFAPVTLGPIGGGDSNSDYCRLTTH